MYAGFISNGDRYRVQGATLLLFATNFPGKLASLDSNSSSMKENYLPRVGFEPTTHGVRVECYNHSVNRTLTQLNISTLRKKESINLLLSSGKFNNIH